MEVFLWAILEATAARMITTAMTLARGKSAITSVMTNVRTDVGINAMMTAVMITTAGAF